MSDYDKISNAVEKAIKIALNRMENKELTSQDQEILGGMYADLSRKIAELEAEKKILNLYLNFSEDDNDIFS